jgi:hypothetical protein
MKHNRTDSYRNATPHAGPPVEARVRTDLGNLTTYRGERGGLDDKAGVDEVAGEEMKRVPAVDAVIAAGRDAETRRTLSFVTAFFIAAAVIISVGSACECTTVSFLL